MNKKLLYIGLVVAAISGGSSVADEKKQTRGEERLAKIEEKYQPTGKIRHCVSLRSLRDSRIIDEQTIFFHGRGKRAYMNRLPHRCPRLAVEERFSYQTTTGQLCRAEIITVIDSMGSAWSSCSLGKFEEWEKKPKAEKDEQN